MPNPEDARSLPDVVAGREFFRAGSGDIREQVQHLNVRQKDFETSLARQLGVDELGLETMYHLISSGTSTPTALAHVTGVSTASMTLVLDRLESAGHVGRAPHPSDRRKVVVTPSQASEELAYQLVGPLIKGLEALVRDLGEHERSIIGQFLGQLLDLYQAVTPTE